jgi:hypothetical protein
MLVLKETFREQAAGKVKQVPPLRFMNRGMRLVVGGLVDSLARPGGNITGFSGSDRWKAWSTALKSRRTIWPMSCAWQRKES